jgi:Flp pilus assembly protein TadG
MKVVNRRTRRERGSTMVESAFIFGTFLFLLIGVLDFGQYLYIHQNLVERARNAARWGAMRQYDVTLHDQIQNMVLYNQPAAGSQPIFNLTAAMVDVRNICDNNPESPSYEVRVTITGYPFQMLSPYVAGAKVGRDIVASSPTEYTTTGSAPSCTGS